MIFKITFRRETGIFSMPMAYQHILEGLVYHMLSEDPEYSAFIHNEGYRYNQYQYKHLTFGPLEGHYEIDHGRISFDGPVHWELRSPDPSICRIISGYLEDHTSCRIGQNDVIITDVQRSEAVFEEGEFRIRMASPIVVSHTTEDRKTIYHNPLENEYSEWINANFRKKFFAAFRQEPPSDIRLLPESIGYRDKVVSKYKNSFWITGWKGEYTLIGDPLCIKFLYETGLGSRNFQGFGMFDIV